MDENVVRVIIAGGRDFSDAALMKEKCDFYLSRLEFKNIVVVSGMARGADLLGVNYANRNNIKIEKFPADWRQFGKRAGMISNRQMAEYADVLIAFWDGKSRGTKNMIETMMSLRKDVRIVRY